ncbi:MAG: hypothetical protein ACYS47_07105, partial [Planctomycetota bacterium]
PPELEAVCLKALALHKADRYGSVPELIEDVRAFQEHRPVSAYRYGPGERVARWVQRHPAASLAGGVALILLCIGGALTATLAALAESNAARASEEAALKREAQALADAETLRAQKAEKREAVATVRADRAEETLEKGRKVSFVLRAANADLGDILAALEKSFYSGASLEEQRATGEKLWPAVERFEKNVPGDPASRAAWFAAKGWLTRLAGRRDEAFDLFERSRNADPDVAYGALFDAMVWLSEYLRKQPMPVLRTERGHLAIHTVPTETPDMRRIRERFETALARVGETKVWSESASQDFQDVLDGFQAVQDMNPDAAERGLSKALGVSEMIWLEGEILLARAKVRFLRTDFKGGIHDVDSVLERFPNWQEAHFTKAVLCFGQGYRDRTQKKDPRPAYRKSIAAFGRALENRSHPGRTRNARGIVRLLLGNAQKRNREDPMKAYRESVDDFTEALQDQPTRINFANRGQAYLTLGNEVAWRKEDPRPWYRKAIDDCTKVLNSDPEHTMALRHRRDAYVRLARILDARGEDPRGSYVGAVRDYDTSLRLDPGNVNLLYARGSALLEMAYAGSRRRMDPRELYRRAVADFDEILGKKPGHIPARHNRGLVLKNLADAEAVVGVDPEPLYRKALEDFNGVLRTDSCGGNAYVNRGLTHSSLGYVLATRGEDPRECYTKALADLMRASTERPKDARIFDYLGRTHRRLGEFEASQGGDALPHFQKSLASFDEALKRSPTFWTAAADKGVLLEEMGRLEEALKVLTEALELSGGKSSWARTQLQRVKKKLEER